MGLVTLIFGLIALAIGAVFIAPKRLIVSWSDAAFRVRLRVLGMAIPLRSGRLGEIEPKKPRSGHRDWETTFRRLTDAVGSVSENGETVIQTVQSVLELGLRFRHWFSLDSGRIDLAFGLGNPAQTGMTHGALSAIAGALAALWPRVVIRSFPNFDSSEFHSQGELSFRIHLGRIIWHLIRFVATTPWWKLWKLKRELAYNESA